jgi:ferrous iron transport protein A
VKDRYAAERNGARYDDNIMVKKLDQVYENGKAKVVDIRGGIGLRQRLGQMGVHPGDVITLLRYGALGGPILIEVHGSQVALGRGIASKVIVETLV